MFCPNCGNANSQEQRFCRLCGLRLDTITQIVQQEFRESKIAHPSPLNLRRIFLTAWHYGFFLIALGIVIISLGKKIIGEQHIADIGSVMSFVGLALLIARGILLLKTQGHATLPPPPKADTTTQLKPLLDAKDSPSVTEFTTRNFDHVYVERNEPEAASSHRRSDS